MIRTKNLLHTIVLGLGATVMVAPGASWAQDPPPDHGSASAEPLFVQDLPAGTITVRISRPSMTEPIVNAQVTGSWTAKDGKPRFQAMKTGADGRASFAGIPAGSSFRAQASVDGEALSTPTFTVPASGGTRLLLIASGRAPRSADEMVPGASLGKAKDNKALAVRSGKVEPRDGMPSGTVDVRVFAADGKTITGLAVNLGRADPGTTSVEFQRAVTDESGIARFSDLKASTSSPYAAVVERDGMRVGTEAFFLGGDRGAAGEIHVPAKTSDLSVLRISPETRMMVEVREEALSVLQNLIVENTSNKVFDPGPSGLFIPLPEGFAGAEKLPGGADIDLKEGVGAFLRTPLPPAQSVGALAQVRLGYLLTTHETADYEIVHPMPLGMAGGIVMVPGENPVTLSAPGLRMRPPERDDNGNELRMYDLDAVPPGQALHLTVRGLPTREQAGKWIAAALVGLLVAAGIMGARRPRSAVAVGDKAG